MIFFKPVEIRKEYINAITKGMTSYFWERMFKPMFSILEGNNTINSKNDLIQAINSGKIYYENGAFKTDGTFSNVVAAELENLGAKFKYGAYYISQAALTPEISHAISFITAREAIKIAALNRLLAGLENSVDDVPLEPFIENTVNIAFRQLEKDIIKSAVEKKIPVVQLGIAQPKIKVSKDKAKEIEAYWQDKEETADKLHKKWAKANEELDKAKQTKGISAQDYNKAVEKEEKASKELAQHQQEKYANAPNLDIETDNIEINYQSKKIAEDYVYNMKYWVKNWEVNNIIKMRQDISEMVSKGARVPTIQKYIEKRWKIASKKAAFLAENESNLVASVIKSARYQEMGSTQFKWGRSSSKEKRKLHKEYYGKIFEYTNPPIIDERLGIKGLPRQIWNCKCHLIPVLPDSDRITRIINAKRNIFTKIKYKIKNSLQRNNSAWRYRRFGQGEAF